MYLFYGFAAENGKKNWNFDNCIFSAVVDLFISKFKKNENLLCQCNEH